MTSEAFALWVQRRREDAKDLAFVIGGAHGLGEPILRTAATRLALAVLLRLGGQWTAVPLYPQQADR